MKKGIKILIIVIVLLLIAGAVFVLYNSRTPEVANDCAADMNTVTYTAAKTFSPTCVKVSSGTTVTYKNESADTLLVAVDPHPIHTGNKEVSNNAFTLDVAPGESKTTTVNQKGTFGIHDHANFTARAIIVVE